MQNLTHYFKIETHCCGREPKVLNSHEDAAFYECRKCGRQFHGPYKPKPEEPKRVEEPTYQSPHPRRKWDGGRKLG